MASATAIVIGGGVIGLSTAYHLARRRFGRVTVLEKAVLGDGSSSRAAGIVTGHLWTETGVLARKRSLALFEELSDELRAHGYTFNQVGCLNLFGAESWPEREALLPIYERHGVPFEVMDAAAIAERWPALRPDPEQIGLFDPVGGYSEPHAYLPALAARARELGVEIVEGCQVTGFVQREGRIRGVETRTAGTEELREADVVICTVHAWTLKLLERLGRAVPLKSFVHQRYLTRPLPEPLELPAINANPQGGYVRPAHSPAGQPCLLAGFETADRAEFRVPSPEFDLSELAAPPGLRQTLTDRLSTLLPQLATSDWASESVGLISFSVDGEPILGALGDLPGLYLGCGFHSGGFAYNPVAGELLAEIVSEGAPSIELSAFSPERFEASALKDYLAKNLIQADAVRRRH
ncbi:MAG: FAD-binding oxidoreductase [Trueperaceae bacterium]|nr:MAG: FAD-binding oxidoreductase [Trueperaceae bacterium]